MVKSYMIMLDANSAILNAMVFLVALIYDTSSRSLSSVFGRSFETCELCIVESLCQKIPLQNFLSKNRSRFTFALALLDPVLVLVELFIFYFLLKIEKKDLNNLNAL